MKKTLLFLAAFLTSAFLNGADVIGVVNMEQIFKEYYKSRIAEDLIRRQGDIYQNYLKQLGNEHRQLIAEAERSRASSQNLAIPEAERRQAAKRAADALKSAEAKKAEAAKYSRARANDMIALQNRKRAEILKDIRQQVSRSAALLGYNFVLDYSGRTANGIGSVMLYPAKRDFTQHVITELNRNRTKSPAKSGGK